MKPSVSSGDKKKIVVYAYKTRKRMVHQACAELWALGMPWAEAFEASSQAINAANAAVRPIAKGKGKGKRRSKGKGKGHKKGKAKAKV